MNREASGLATARERAGFTGAVRVAAVPPRQPEFLICPLYFRRLEDGISSQCSNSRTEDTAECGACLQLLISGVEDTAGSHNKELVSCNLESSA